MDLDYFILTDNNLFRLIRGEDQIDPNVAYQNFVVQVIDLCKQADDGYKAVALTCAETELQFVSGVSEYITLSTNPLVLILSAVWRMS